MTPSWPPSRVAILTHQFRGGPFASLGIALARGLRESGVAEVDLVYMELPPVRSLPEGVRAVPLGRGRSSLAPFAIADFLAKRRPQLFISMPAIVNLAAVPAWLMARVADTTLIVSDHTTMSYSCWVEHRDQLKLRFMPPLARIFYPRASGVHAVSTGVLDDLLHTIGVQIPPDRRAVIPNAIELDRVRRMSRSMPDHPWLERPRQIPVALAVGRLEPVKNYPLLLDAVERVRRRMPMRLIVLGEGGERRRLEEEIRRRRLEDAVALLGVAENPYGYMAAADALVLASVQEGFALVLVEAMACGAPVLATATSGAVDIVRPGSGEVVPLGDADALADALARILEDPSAAAALREGGNRRAEDFAPKVVAQRWLAFAESIR